MKSIVIGIAIILLSLNAVGTLNMNAGVGAKENVIMFEKDFSLNESKKDGFYRITSPQCRDVATPYKPVIPEYVKTYLFPAGSRVRVNVEVKNVRSMGEINLMPSYNVVPPDMESVSASLTHYNNSIVYPETWYKYELHGGIVEGKHYTIMKLMLYPVRYVNGSVYESEKFNVKISYEVPSKEILNNDQYELLIVAPSKFDGEAQQLAQHKESHGIKTLVVSMENIKNSMNGRDDAEKLKYFIKDAIEQYGIKYVLLLGGRMPGKEERWWVPVRYANVAWPTEPPYPEMRYVTDLYYADIYDGNYNFSSWDSNGNGIYGEWPKNGKLMDKMDLYPDVYVGRLACRNEIEAKLMVNKIIEYENMDSMEKKVVGVGGDNFDDPSTEYVEGEIVTQKTIDYLEEVGFTSAKVWATQEDVNPSNIKKALGNGAMFIHLHGHGSPIYWSTHKKDDFSEWQKGLSIFDMPLFFNKQYPIFVYGGCHTAMFNVSLSIHAWTGGMPVPEGLSWWTARKYGGAGIASLGYACFPVAYVGEQGDLDGNGVNEPDCVEGGYGYMELGLFEGYAEHGIDMLGELWGYTETRYLNTFDCLSYTWEIHTVHGFTLLGDPSLKIGGYGS